MSLLKESALSCEVNVGVLTYQMGEDAYFDTMHNLKVVTRIKAAIMIQDCWRRYKLLFQRVKLRRKKLIREWWERFRPWTKG